MAEYIEREATVELLRSLGSRDYRREKGTICEAIKMVSFSEYTPAADVAPVRHAHWEEWLPGMSVILTGEEMLYMCSNCTAKYEDVEGMRYCPNCGAKMGGERKEKEKAMSIDEAIQHCEEMALCAKNGECGEEHRQLAEWLIELKRLRAELVRHGTERAGR